MQITDYIKTYDNILPLEHLSSLIKWASTQKFEQAETLGGLDRDIRRAETLPLFGKHKSKTNMHWYNYLGYTFSNILGEYRKICKHLPTDFHLDMAILKYEQTGFYKFHVDDCAQIHRQLTLIYLLNNDYEGGELCFANPSNDEMIGNVDVVANRLIVWPSNFLYPHGVKPVTKGKRYSLVAWAV
jgi:Rps23 Pro-64 3,4-dihydroxylase Tpa1-like proline 4-hydroxylase